MHPFRKLIGLAAGILLLAAASAPAAARSGGTVLWQYGASSSGSYPPSVATDGERVYLASAECSDGGFTCTARFRALDADDGAPVWERSHDVPVGGYLHLRLAGPRLIAAWDHGGDGGVVLALRAADGGFDWADEFLPGERLFLEHLQVRDGGVAVTGTLSSLDDDTGLVRVYSESGGLLWEARTGRASRAAVVEIDGEVVIVGGMRFVDGQVNAGSRIGVLWAHDRASGQRLWRRLYRPYPLTHVDALALADGALYAAFGEHLVALDARSGRRLWRRRVSVSKPLDWDDSPLVVLDGRLLAQGRLLQSRRIADGRRVWRAGGRARNGRVAVGDDAVVVAGTRRRPGGPRFAWVGVHDTASGRRLWTRRFDARWVSDVAAAGALALVTGTRESPGGRIRLYVRAYRVR